MNKKNNYSLKQLNTFGLDCYSNFFIEISSENDLIEFLNDRKEKFIVLGGGSNILFIEDFDGVVLKMNIKGKKQIYEDEQIIRIEYGAGEEWNEIVENSIVQNLGGIENLILIPGTIGGGVIQNIGAYGVELKDSFYCLKALEIETKKECIFSKEECLFGYRKSVFNSLLKDKFVITYVTLEFSKFPKINLSYKILENETKNLCINDITIKDIAEIIKSIRIKKLPNPKILGNAGSFFKNPFIEKAKFLNLKYKFPGIPCLEEMIDHVKIPAAWLIDNLGWKGKRLENTGTCINNPLVLVNYGGASGKQIYEFSRKLKHEVLRVYEVELSEEVNIILQEI